MELVPDTLRRTLGLCLRAKGCILESNVTLSVCGHSSRKPRAQCGVCDRREVRLGHLNAPLPEQ